jgi:hypothetical protein
MSDIAPSVETYLLNQIRELIRLGPIHALTWVSQSDPGSWLQLSVHDGEQHYLTALCVLPPRGAKKQLDRLLGKTGRRQPQANQGVSLIYYLIPSDSAVHLMSQAAKAAHEIATILAFLWKATTVQQIELLGARGPKLPLYEGQSPALPEARSRPALPEDIELL